MLEIIDTIIESLILCEDNFGGDVEAAYKHLGNNPDVKLRTIELDDIRLLFRYQHHTLILSENLLGVVPDNMHPNRDDDQEDRSFYTLTLPIEYKKAAHELISKIFND